MVLIGIPLLASNKRLLQESYDIPLVYRLA